MKVFRVNRNSKGTEGLFFLEGNLLGHTLEDVVRDLKTKEDKIFGETAIPAGKYAVEVQFSNHFQKRLPRILNVPFFEGVLIHGGNTVADTEGCVLLGLLRYAPNAISHSLSDLLVASLDKAPGPHSIEIINDGPDGTYGNPT